MNPVLLKKVLNGLARGRITVAEAMERLRHLPFQEIGHSTVDRHRALRQGYPEVIFCEGKTVQEIVQIAAHICATGENLLATRAGEEVYQKLRQQFPNAVYHRRARVVTVELRKLRKAKGFIAVVSAGTADAPVAEEAAVTAEIMGNAVRRFYDVGVAGLHRIISKLPELSRARVIVVAAGMEGALPSVVGGLVGTPVIAVPTSVGYGASFKGVAALLGMLNSCAAGVTVVNIDNGFGAGYAAALINKR
ncbi:MAG: nickel pincer cofactor biosynthesis protein LarB [Candidatus Aureabacteria bacterium]|nr:nickel pincer cofactor biosynthesis protein LarB [Candidatus Auribacterota bacterium]